MVCSFQDMYGVYVVEKKHYYSLLYYYLEMVFERIIICTSNFGVLLFQYTTVITERYYFVMAILRR